MAKTSLVRPDQTIANLESIEAEVNLLQVRIRLAIDYLRESGDKCLYLMNYKSLERLLGGATVVGKALEDSRLRSADHNPVTLQECFDEEQKHTRSPR